jgi:hypothetical protein
VRELARLAAYRSAATRRYTPRATGWGNAPSVAPLFVNEYFGLGPADAGRLSSPDTYQGNLYVYPTAS